MPSVQQASMPSARTPRTMSSTRLELFAFGDVAPGGAHAEARRALLARAARRLERLVDAHQVVAIDAGVVVRRLRAVGAVLRAAAGLDAQEHAALHFVGDVIRAVHRLRAEHQVEQRRRVDRFDLGDRPVVPDRRPYRWTGWMSSMVSSRHAPVECQRRRKVRAIGRRRDALALGAGGRLARNPVLVRLARVALGDLCRDTPAAAR